MSLVRSVLCGGQACLCGSQFDLCGSPAGLCGTRNKLCGGREFWMEKGSQRVDWLPFYF